MLQKKFMAYGGPAKGSTVFLALSFLACRHDVGWKCSTTTAKRGTFGYIWEGGRGGWGLPPSKSTTI
jgi:hypothetical protein